MPTYHVTAAAGLLDADAKSRIAQEITRVHSEATSAQSFFAQVIFHDVTQGNHFLGGKPLASEQVFIHGFIRAGRTADQKRALIQNMVDAVADATSIAKRFLWAYLSELPPSQMVEYGYILPEPGAENAWLESMPADDRLFVEKGRRG
jgi:phenylpyruvate tautomerase PptA (4-oxalocrotonate tautomerase family)